MNYLIIEDNVISNIIVADEEFAQLIGAKEFYKGAYIGATYDPPTLDKLQEATATLAQTLADLIYQADLEKLNGGTV